MPYPISAEILTKLQAIRDEPANDPFCTILTLAPTVKATPWTYLKIAKNAAPGRKKFLVTAGVHGNEWVPPLAVLNLTKNILDAYHAGNTLTIGALTASSAQIKKVVDDIDIYVAPIVNPDGYDH